MGILRKLLCLPGFVFVLACGEVDTLKEVGANSGLDGGADGGTDGGSDGGADGGTPEAGPDAAMAEQACWQEQARFLDQGGFKEFGAHVAVSQGTAFASTRNDVDWQVVALSKTAADEWFVDRSLRGPDVGSDATRLIAMIATEESVWMSEQATTGAVVRRASLSLEPDPNTISAPIDAAAFGSALAADGEWLLVGDPGTTGGGTVHAYAIGVADVVPFQSFQSPQPQAGDGFGLALAIRDGRLLVGAPDQGLGVDRVYQYQLTGNAWSLVQMYEPPNERVEGLGESVAWLATDPVMGAPRSAQCVAECYGRAAVAGTQGCSSSLAPCMAVGSVYTADGSDLNLLSAGAAGTDDNYNLRFGTSLAVAEDWLVVGARFDPSCAFSSPLSVSCLSSGAVHVFRRTDDGLEPFRYLKPNDIEDRAHFGTSVASEGSLLVVGAPNHRGTPANELPTGSGAVYIFNGCDDPGS